MKNTLILIGLMSISIRADEREAQLRSLTRMHNVQGAALLLSMLAIGAKGVLDNADAICANDPFCWKLTVPLISLSLGGVYMIGKKLVFKGKA